MKNITKFIFMLAGCVAGAVVVAAVMSPSEPVTPKIFFERISEFRKKSREELRQLMWQFAYLDTDEGHQAAATIRDMINSQTK